MWSHKGPSNPNAERGWNRTTQTLCACGRVCVRQRTRACVHSVHARARARVCVVWVCCVGVSCLCCEALRLHTAHDGVV